MKRKILFFNSVILTFIFSLFLCPSISFDDSSYTIDTTSDSVIFTYSDRDSRDTINYWNENNIKEAVNNPEPLLSLEENYKISSNSLSLINTYTNFKSIHPVVPTRVLNTNSSDNGITKDYTARPTGKLVYTIGDVDAGCTASFVDSKSKRLLVTAAHCLYNPEKKQWASNIMFFPNYGKGQQGFPVGKMSVLKNWQNRKIKNGKLTNEDMQYDVGIASINTSVLPNELKRPVEIYGAHGFGHSSLTNFDARIFGYPWNPGNSEIPFSCSTKAKKYTGFGHNFPPFFDILQADGCNIQTPSGMSGGPWIQLYNPSKGTGWINGVSSAGSSKESLYSPVFNNMVYKLYTDAVDSGM